MGRDSILSEIQTHTRRTPAPTYRALRTERYRYTLETESGTPCELFDLEADPEAIAQARASDRGLRPRLRRLAGVRVPGAWDGFELAVRAAFRVVNGGGQVCVLVPTTILAQQHYETFCERLADLPVDGSSTRGTVQSLGVSSWVPGGIAAAAFITGDLIRVGAQ